MKSCLAYVIMGMLLAVQFIDLAVLDSSETPVPDRHAVSQTVTPGHLTLIDLSDALGLNSDFCCGCDSLHHMAPLPASGALIRPCLPALLAPHPAPGAKGLDHGPPVPPPLA